ncbi:MAG TPA: hypothetical protein VI542_24335 [Candidatus Tectomicrobia bacterium]
MDEEADEDKSGQEKLVKQEVWCHDDVPFHADERRLFYRIDSLSNYPLSTGTGPDKTNAKQRGVDWQFRIENARVKLKRLYPKIKA